MPDYFADSSALTKRYVSETGTAWVQGLTNASAGNGIFVARIVGVEVISAITRRANRGELTPSDAQSAVAQFRTEFATDYIVLDVSPAVVARAMDLAEAHKLRGYDAVHLAAARQAQSWLTTLGFPGLTFLSADAGLNAAAAAEGLTVDDPNAHP